MPAKPKTPLPEDLRRVRIVATVAPETAALLSAEAARTGRTISRLIDRLAADAIKPTKTGAKSHKRI